MSVELGISCKASLFKKKFFSGDLFFDVLIIGLIWIYVFMGQTQGEKSWGITFRIERFLTKTQALGDLGVKQVSNTMINIGLVTLPL